jgi:hypothetical protein
MGGFEMTMVSKPGARLRSAVSDVEVVVVRPSAEDLDLTCAGVPMVGVDDTPAAGSVDGETVQLGKRYFDDRSGLELLCSKAGAGPLSVDGRPLDVRGAKALPSSD